MSVESFDPNQAAPAVTMTPAAVEHARRQIQQAGASGIRLAVKESGCSGYMYVVDFVSEANDSDLQFAVADDVTLFVQQSALPIVRGTEIDFGAEGVNRVIKFNNPNVSAECGCGESFIIDEEESV
ncbi:[Fe-S]-binding protein [Saccharospirillum sp. MSK14-1]|uniref:HesB/IscA family protein n=1 Tax=Saccharospirillum sp. MSK14-1 TaxID=1897632 RepID=UPI000D33AB5D|nr:iron-sulfur cluster assembly accessory protein [Saccharospirillum sp. MSK14-1]PTY36086.1 [Fe-S]-binding protein [Saccharospirillum sp. MSK14-1]